jgi:hypothetical protein
MVTYILSYLLIGFALQSLNLIIHRKSLKDENWITFLIQYIFAMLAWPFLLITALMLILINFRGIK